jgi:hypothetical protein
LLLQLGRFSAVASGLLALWTFWPRGFKTVRLVALRDLYLRAEEPFTELHILDAQIEMAQETARVIRGKARRLKASMVALASSTLLTAIGFAVR